MEDPKASNQLQLDQSWNDETPIDEVPEEHRERVAAERAKAAEASAAQAAAAVDKAVKKVVERAGSRAETRARVTKPAATTGARKRKQAEPEDAGPEPERVTVVLKTSRYTGRNGRAIARKTPVLVTIDRACQLIMLDHAREPTEADAPPKAYLD